MPSSQIKFTISQLPSEWKEERDGDRTKFIGAGAQIDAGKGDFEAALVVYNASAKDALKTGTEYVGKAWEWQHQWSVSISGKDNPSLASHGGGFHGKGGFNRESAHVTEKAKFSSFACSYAKDLIMGGIIPPSDFEDWSRRIFDQLSVLHDGTTSATIPQSDAKQSKPAYSQPAANDTDCPF